MYIAGLCCGVPRLWRVDREDDWYFGSGVIA